MEIGDLSKVLSRAKKDTPLSTQDCSAGAAPGSPAQTTGPLEEHRS
jgi:hypothetical protein